MSNAYYNEIEPFAAEWLRKLILFGHIAPGDVDERSIEDVSPDELKGYEQCHFFAGIGVWSYALRQAGWADDRQIWTGSCPCQPFSAAGKRGGTADERHLWPAWQYLVGQCRPGVVVVGEQVASKDGLAWLDTVSADMEGEGYAFGAFDMCAAGFGAPHIRQRSYFVGLADTTREIGSGRGICRSGESDSALPRQAQEQRSERSSPSGGLADANGGNTGTERQQRSGEQRQQPQDGSAGHLRCDARLTGNAGNAESTRSTRRHESSGSSGDLRPCATNGRWGNADWLFCTDGKWRPVESGTFPLAHGVAGRVGLLRGFGNAIVAPVAQGFIEAVMDCAP